MMSFLVQDLLDYAQIKSGKFRINIRPFNIRDAIEKVMCIQRDKANASDLYFRAEFENIDDKDEEEPEDPRFCVINSGGYSPVLYSDEQRIM